LKGAKNDNHKNKKNQRKTLELKPLWLGDTWSWARKNMGETGGETKNTGNVLDEVQRFPCALVVIV